MRCAVLVSLTLVFLSGCLVTSRPSSDGALNAMTCQGVSAHTGLPIVCIPTENGLLLQTESQQITLNMENATITFDSTLYWMLSGTTMHIIALDGAASVTAEGVTRVLRAGNSTRLDSSPTLVTVGSPTNPTEADRSLLLNLPLDNLPRRPERQPVAGSSPPLATGAPQPTSTPDSVIAPAPLEAITPTTPDLQATPEAETVACVIPPDWNTVYRVQAGDTLTRISLEYNIGIAEIIEGNCLANPDQLALGQEIFLPAGLAGEIRPGSASFTVERDVIVGGDCVSLSWESSGAVSASIDGIAVPLSGTQSVCPAATRVYELAVTFASGEEADYSLTITVTQ